MPNGTLIAAAGTHYSGILIFLRSPNDRRVIRDILKPPNRNGKSTKRRVMFAYRHNVTLPNFIDEHLGALAYLVSLSFTAAGVHQARPERWDNRFRKNCMLHSLHNKGRADRFSGAALIC
jgi:hypothetical protein